MMPSAEAPVVITTRTLQTLHLLQSVLSGLQVLAAAAILGDVMGAKGAALFIVMVQAIQQGVNYYTNKAVVATMSRADTVVTRAEQVTEHASETVTALAAAMPAGTASKALLEQERKPNG
jgi:hypothetical protein